MCEKAEVCIFCDISVDSAVYLAKKSNEEKKNNVLVIRCDYFFPQFKDGTFDFLLCNDTLIYGVEHEKALLSSIYKILSKGGIAVLDFSNRYHRGFYHKPYTYAYSFKEMKSMLEEAGFLIQGYIPLYYELSSDLEEKRLISKLLKLILPPTRYIFKVTK